MAGDGPAGMGAVGAAAAAGRFCRMGLSELLARAWISDMFRLMIASILSHPVTTFIAGTVIGVAGIGVFLSSCAPPNRSSEKVGGYRDALSKAGGDGPAPGSAAEKAAVERFTSFLQHINDEQFIRENTAKTYRADAYLDDTLTTHRGAAAIEAYFLQTAESLTDSTVTIDDVVRSGQDHYIRWTMVISAKPLAGGQPVHSIGMSQVRFDADGKV
ncbi:MAG: nuclear transport factor 2 family protein, partial [Verrucomicrobiaceae bacterium]